MIAIAASATSPAPRKRGRVKSKPTVESQPLEHDQTECGKRDPGPDLELAAVDRVDGDRVVVRRQCDAVGWLELGDLVREEIHCEPRPVRFPGYSLLARVEAGQVGLAKGGDRTAGQRSTAAVRPHDGDGGGACLRDDRHGLVGMKAV